MWEQVILTHHRIIRKSVTQTLAGSVCLHIVLGTTTLTNGSELLESHGKITPNEPDVSGFENSRQRSQTRVWTPKLAPSWVCLVLLGSFLMCVCVFTCVWTQSLSHI